MINNRSGNRPRNIINIIKKTEFVGKAIMLRRHIPALQNFFLEFIVADITGGTGGISCSPPRPLLSEEKAKDCLTFIPHQAGPVRRLKAPLWRHRRE